MKICAKYFLLFLALGFLLGVSEAMANESSYIVLATDTANLKKLERQIRSVDGRITSRIPEIRVLVVSSANPAFKVDAAKFAGVRSVVPDIVLQWIDPNMKTEFAAKTKGKKAKAAVGNPPTSGDDDALFDLQWGMDAIDAPEAWNAGYRGNGARVAILDSGIDCEHPDLAPNLNLGLSTSFVGGEDVCVSPGAYFNHGSHVAGIAAAADNGVGVIGVAPEAEIVAVKVLSEFTGSGSFSGVINGIVYAALVDADVINMSLGATLKKSGFFAGGVFVPANEVAELYVAIARATNFANNLGTTIIASAGNSGIDFDHTADIYNLPSNAPHVLSIAATGPLGWGQNASTNLDVPSCVAPDLSPGCFYTNFGQSVISLGAPGGNLHIGLFFSPGTMCTVAGLTRSCWVFDLVMSASSESWFWALGTSMAAPHVTGVAALIIAKNGGSMPPGSVKTALFQSADDKGKPGKDDFFGNGRVNAYKAVQ